MLKEIFSKTVRDKWRADLSSEELRQRLEILEASGPEPSDPYKKTYLKYLIKRKSAWDTYLSSANTLKLLDGEYGKDLIARLQDPNYDNFRSAMAECMAAWFLAGKLKFQLTPRPKGRKNNNPLEFLIKSNDDEICVEVKSPYRDATVGGWGDGSDLLQAALESANKQFKPNVANLLAIIPEFPLSVFSYRRQLTTAFFGNQAIVIPINTQTGGPAGPETIEVIASGHFLRRTLPSGKPFKANGDPRFTRVSSVISIEETINEGLSYVEHNALVIHNPYSTKPLSREIWKDIPQFIPEENEIKWTDGASPWH